MASPFRKDSVPNYSLGCSRGLIRGGARSRKMDARSGALGVKRSKAGASLRYAVADARYWAERF